MTGAEVFFAFWETIPLSNRLNNRGDHYEESSIDIHLLNDIDGCGWCGGPAGK